MAPSKLLSAVAGGKIIASEEIPFSVMNLETFI
jgi:hypothetical protein